MPLEQLANVAEVFGMLMVAVTLIFLTFQMLQNTKAIRSTASRSASEMARSVFAPIATDPEIAEIVVRGLRDPSDLSTVETARFTALFNGQFFTWQDWFYQHQQGVLDDAIWSGLARSLRELFQSPGIQDYWQHRAHFYSGAFRTYVDSDLQEMEPTSNFRVLGRPRSDD